MTSIYGVPPSTQAQSGIQIASTRLIYIAHRSAGVVNATNIQVSPQLPTPCVILGWTWTSSAQSATSRPHSAALYIANNDSYDYDENTNGERITSHRDAGSIPPDPDVPNPLDINKAYPNIDTFIPLWIPVYHSPSYIKSALRQTILGSNTYWYCFLIGLIAGTAEDPTRTIVPRGTPDQPVCVNICGIEPGAYPPTLPTPGAPTPGAPAAPTPAELDPLAAPLPSPCPIDPQNPLQGRPQLCDVP